MKGLPLRVKAPLRTKASFNRYVDIDVHNYVNYIWYYTFLVPQTDDKSPLQKIYEIVFYLSKPLYCFHNLLFFFLNKIFNSRVDTVDSGYSHTKYFQAKCHCKRSATLSGVAQKSELDYRKYDVSFTLAQKLFPSTFCIRNVLKGYTTASYNYYYVRLEL